MLSVETIFIIYKSENVHTANKACTYVFIVAKNADTASHTVQVGFVHIRKIRKGEIRMNVIKSELYNDNFQNYKR